MAARDGENLSPFLFYYFSIYYLFFIIVLTASHHDRIQMLLTRKDSPVVKLVQFKVLYQFRFVGNILKNPIAQMRADLKNFGNEVDFIAAFKRMNKNAFLKFIKIKFSEFAPQGIARVPSLFRNIKYDDAPFPVPFFWLCDLHIVNFKSYSMKLAFFREHNLSFVI